MPKLKHQTFREKAQAHMASADRKQVSLLEGRLASVRAFFARARKGAPPFAEEALSWSGKWALIKNKLRIGEREGHAKFLAEAFGKHVFSGEALQAVLEDAVKGFLSDLDGIENELLIKLRADLADEELRQGRPTLVQSDDAFGQEYRRLAADVKNTLEHDLKVTAGREAVSFVAMDVAASVVLRVAAAAAAELGLEAGILGTGAASGVATLGIGLVAAVIVDYAAGYVLKWAGYAPEQAIAGKVVQAIDKVETALLDGDGQKTGLRRELEKIQSDRSRIRNAVVQKLVSERSEK